VCPSRSGCSSTGSRVPGAHGGFLGVILFVLDRNGASLLRRDRPAQRAYGCLGVVVLLAVDFIVDLPGLRRMPFRALEQTAGRRRG
jgi:hypothetical protein